MTEILIVVAIVAVFFGPGKLPQVMETLGQGIKSFRASAREAADEDEGPPKA